MTPSRSSPPNWEHHMQPGTSRSDAPGDPHATPPPTTATGHWPPSTTANTVEPAIASRGCPLPVDPTTRRPASVEASTRVGSGTPSARRVVTVVPDAFPERTCTPAPGCQPQRVVALPD